MEKKSRKNKSDWGDDFVAPDGGWGWLICIAGGLSNMCILPIFQTFGLIYRDKLLKIGLTNSQITTIINTVSAVSFSTGLFNGPMFRKFTYRKISLTGAAFTTIGIYLSSMANSFATYLISFSLIYGFGLGISMSSTAITMNTFFKQKRRNANSFMWAITGTSTIFVPYLVNFLINIYGTDGTIMLFSGFAMHTFIFSLLYQPVKWHIKKPINFYENIEKNQFQLQSIENITNNIPNQTIIHNEQQVLMTNNNRKICEKCDLLIKKPKSRKSTGLFSSLDELQITGYEILEPNTPILSINSNRNQSNNNHKWYQSKQSIHYTQSQNHLNSLSIDNHKNQIINSNSPHLNYNSVLENFLIKSDSILICHCSNSNSQNNSKTNLNHVNHVNHVNHENHDENIEPNETANVNENVNISEKSLKWYEKCIKFFDLDLLNDFTYVNLLIGLTLTGFTEINFSILTPFILYDFGYNIHQITLAMALLGLSDVLVRFLIPFLTNFLNFNNMIIYLFGIIGLIIGRIIISQIPTFHILIIVFIWMGICKAIRTVFMGLVIPDHVQLNRLPAAAGLQLLSTGIFSLICGPLVGIIRDAYNYSVTVNILNVISMICVISWTVELLYHAKQRRTPSPKL